ncbi:MBL fold metallo-hydrolase [Oleiharenicola lentus]|uniref:MBL fold metallo-hydrolase n=1 Tax=Oleiharenicola lentus TaxID=2508720 RepID=UPI003F6802E4
MRFLQIGLLCLLGITATHAAEIDTAKRAQARSVKVTVLSTMLADGPSLGEWGFAALVEVDGHRILFDTGAHTDVVLKNAAALKIDLSTVPEVILSHSHWDHIGGLVTLRESVKEKNSSALATVHGAEGLFYKRLDVGPLALTNPLLVLKPDYEATGGTFKIHPGAVQLYPGVWLTGPIPRKFPERNWSGDGTLQSPKGVVEDTVPEDAALIIDTAEGLVVITGCGHAGVVNILDYARTLVRPAKVHALIGGLHLFNAKPEALAWTADKLREFGVENLIGAHCTGIETVYQLRDALKLDRAHAVVGATGAGFELGHGIKPGTIAK